MSNDISIQKNEIKSTPLKMVKSNYHPLIDLTPFFQSLLLISNDNVRVELNNFKKVLNNSKFKIYEEFHKINQQILLKNKNINLDITNFLIEISGVINFEKSSCLGLIKQIINILRRNFNLILDLKIDDNSELIFLNNLDSLRDNYFLYQNTFIKNENFIDKNFRSILLLDYCCSHCNRSFYKFQTFCYFHISINKLSENIKFYKTKVEICENCNNKSLIVKEKFYRCNYLIISNNDENLSLNSKFKFLDSDFSIVSVIEENSESVGKFFFLLIIILKIKKTFLVLC